MKPEGINTILVITLSNIGDVILTTPVMDALIKNYPAARIDIITGPNAVSLFTSADYIRDIFSYNKHAGFFEKLRLLKALRKRRYDLAVDLRHTAIPLFIGARHRTPLLFKKPAADMYAKDIHLAKLKTLDIAIEGADFLIRPSGGDREYIDNILAPYKATEDFIAMAPGARSSNKRWGLDGFQEVAAELLKKEGRLLIMVGDNNDRALAESIKSGQADKILNLCGKTSLMQLAALLIRSSLLISNDSAPMHMATAVNTPVVAIFGPTDALRYGPRRKHDFILQAARDCLPCKKAQCIYNHECFKLIKPADIMEKADYILKNTE